MSWAQQVSKLFSDLNIAVVDEHSQLVSVDADVVEAAMKRQHLDAFISHASEENTDVMSTVRDYIKGVRGGEITSYEPQQFMALGHGTSTKALAQLRVGAHWLRLNTGRHEGLRNRQLRTCRCCAAGVVEDEAHMLFECSLYDPLRLEYDDLFQAPVVEGKRVMSFLNQQPVARVAKYVAECKARHAQELAGDGAGVAVVVGGSE